PFAGFLGASTKAVPLGCSARPPASSPFDTFHTWRPTHTKAARRAPGSDGPVVRDVRFDAQPLHRFLRAESTLGMGSLDDVARRVVSRLVFPLGHGDDIEPAGAGDLLQDGIAHETRLPPEKFVRLANLRQKLLAS